MTDLVLLAYSHGSLFDSMMCSLGHGLMYAGTFRVMRGVSLPVAIGLMLLVLAIAWMVSRRS